MEKQTTIIEVNGIKLEVDLRYATRIDTLRIGSRVKCLVKSYGGGMSTHPGIVVGFEPFKSLPSIIVAYLDTGYGSSTLKFQTFNEKTTDFEVVADLDNNSLEVDRAHILKRFANEEAQKERELEEIRQKRQFFVDHFGLYFADQIAETQTER